jgi:hypothetical protein
MKHRTPRKTDECLEANMPGLNRPLAFPELARLRSAEQSFNVKTQRMTSYQRAQVVLLTFGLVAAVSAAVIALRAAIWVRG